MKREFDEQYDTHIEVALNPYGAWQAIQALTAERDALADKLEKATRFVRGFACRAKTQEHGPDEMGLIDLDTLRFQRDCDIVEARATLAQITGQTDG